MYRSNTVCYVDRKKLYKCAAYLSNFYRFYKSLGAIFSKCYIVSAFLKKQIGKLKIENEFAIRYFFFTKSKGSKV